MSDKTFKQMIKEWHAKRLAYQQRSINARNAGYFLDADRLWGYSRLVFDILYELDSGFDCDPNAPEQVEPIRPTDMADKELLFLAELLDQASEVIANRICGDMTHAAGEIFNDEEKQALAVSYEAWNSDGREEPCFSYQAWPWLSFYAAKFRKAAQEQKE